MGLNVILSTNTPVISFKEITSLLSLSLPVSVTSGWTYPPLQYKKACMIEICFISFYATIILWPMHFIFCFAELHQAVWEITSVKVGEGDRERMRVANNLQGLLP